jgi:hypothetical protein
MRLPILSIFLVAAALLGEIHATPAQSPTSYPWCARSYKMETSAISCYFTSPAAGMLRAEGSVTPDYRDRAQPRPC